MRIIPCLVAVLVACSSPKDSPDEQLPAPSDPAGTPAASAAARERAARRDVALAEAAAHSPIKGDEEVQLFATYATRSDTEGESWEVPVHGWIYEPAERDLLRASMLKGLREILGDEVSGPILESRLRPFIVDSESRKEVPVEAGGSVGTSPGSGSSGHFDLWLSVSAEAASQFARQPRGRSSPLLLPMQAVTRAADWEHLRGHTSTTDAVLALAAGGAIQRRAVVPLAAVVRLAHQPLAV